ncbi:unnamed protein product [Arabidopsis thaliana]|uniref:(thale cress) hypothetical protein n=1 Tax=Arabidopsis thaliana TaxID=3702 RepID=A0A7G2F4X6_ARATH|nr:unnamed protein product [Arabidopsis thaliana]
MSKKKKKILLLPVSSKFARVLACAQSGSVPLSSSAPSGSASPPSSGLPCAGSLALVLPVPLVFDLEENSLSPEVISETVSLIPKSSTLTPLVAVEANGSSIQPLPTVISSSIGLGSVSEISSAGSPILTPSVGSAPLLAPSSGPVGSSDMVATKSLSLGSAIPQSSTPISGSSSQAPSSDSKIDLPWVAKFKASLHNLKQMSQPTYLEDGTPVVIAPSSVLLKSAALWKGHVVAQFHGSCPPATRIFSDLNPIWGNYGDITVRIVSETVALIFIPALNTRQWVVDVGFWQAGNCSCTVYPWSPEGLLNIDELKTAPTWTVLKNVPPQLYSLEGISVIASAIGGNSARVDVEYPRPPPKCLNCGAKEVALPPNILPAAGSSDSVRGVDLSPPIAAEIPLSKSKRRRSRSKKRSLSSPPRITDPLLPFSPQSSLSSQTLASKRSMRDSIKDPDPSFPLPMGWTVMSTKAKKKELKKWHNRLRSSEAGSIDLAASKDLEEENANSVLASTLPGWRMDSNYCCSDLGRIWIVWDPSISVLVFKKTDQFMLCRIKLPNLSQSFAVAFVYGRNNDIERRSLWEDISVLSRSSPLSHTAWLLLGDFNQIAASSEHYSITQSAFNIRGMEDFQGCLRDNQLSDLPTRGVFFTWSNHQQDNPIIRKLDRALANDEWFSSFPSALAVFDPPGVSDHASCIVMIDNQPEPSKKCFKYFSFLSSHPTYLAALAVAWEENTMVGSDMFTLRQQLKQAKLCCRKLNRLRFSNIQQRTAQALSRLEEIQVDLLTVPSDSLFRQEHVARKQWDFFAAALESFFRQKSRIRWLHEGDANTRFFHKAVIAHQANNLIKFLRGEDDSRVENVDQIKGMLVAYYSHLLGSPSENVTPFPAVQANQVGFIKGRLLCENVLLASELVDNFQAEGLGINREKTALLLDGGNFERNRHLAANLGITHGSLPVRYLGVPLMAQKMKRQDYQPLVDRISMRFSSWTARHLSFAGRLQLLQSVIYSTITFWASIFILPNQCLRKLEQLCNAFLWTGAPNSARGAKISWNIVCTAKEAGGLDCIS